MDRHVNDSRLRQLGWSTRFWFGVLPFGSVEQYIDRIPKNEARGNEGISVAHRVSVVFPEGELSSRRLSPTCAAAQRKVCSANLRVRSAVVGRDTICRFRKRRENDALGEVKSHVAELYTCCARVVDKDERACSARGCARTHEITE